MRISHTVCRPSIAGTQTARLLRKLDAVSWHPSRPLADDGHRPCSREESAEAQHVHSCLLSSQPWPLGLGGVEVVANGHKDEKPSRHSVQNALGDERAGRGLVDP